MLRKSCLLTSGQSHLTEQWLNTDNELQPILRSSGLKQMMSTAKFPTGLLRGIFSNNWIQLLTQQYQGHKTVHLEFIHGMAVDANCARLAMGGTLSSYEYAVLLSWCRPTCFAGRFCYVINFVINGLLTSCKVPSVSSRSILHPSNHAVHSWVRSEGSQPP